MIPVLVTPENETVQDTSVRATLCGYGAETCSVSGSRRATRVLRRDLGPGARSVIAKARFSDGASHPSGLRWIPTQATFRLLFRRRFDASVGASRRNLRPVSMHLVTNRKASAISPLLVLTHFMYKHASRDWPDRRSS